jgi:hypothetical protein
LPQMSRRHQVATLLHFSLMHVVCSNYSNANRPTEWSKNIEKSTGCSSIQID